MRCLVLLLSVVACARMSVAETAGSCVFAEEFFMRHNVTADESEPGPICGGHCCGRGQELRLRMSLTRAVETLATTKWTRELLLSTRLSLQDHLTGLSHLSQNKTATLFTQLYREHATRTMQPITTLYEDIRIFLRPAEKIAIANTLNSKPPKDFTNSVKKFFRDIFPVAYHNVLKLNLEQFTPEYESCLKDAYDAVQPFGDVPQLMGTSLSQSLESARVLLQMLSVGADTLTNIELILSSVSESCGDRVMKAAGCSRCHGHAAPPCRNYCLNVARGCIGSVLSALEGPWAGYVEGVERLTKVDADMSLREMESKISRAIIYAMETKDLAENKVRQECGPPSTMESLKTSAPFVSPGSIRRENLRAPPPDTELLQFAATLASTKKVFSGLADRLCDQPDFTVEDGLEACWNGDDVADYKKPLVPSASLIDQKYNPEISGSPPQNPKVAVVADRLQQARQLLMIYAHSNDVTAEAFMQGDEAGEEGSGSGRNYPDDYDSEGSGDDGSGDHDGTSRTYINESPPDSSTPRTSAAGSLHPTSTLAALFTFAYLILTHN